MKSISLAILAIFLASAAIAAEKPSQAFLKKAIVGNYAEVQMGQLAQQKSQNDDVKKLTSPADERFRAGTSEIKNWIALAGAMSGTSLGPKMVDYIPCYRTEAGNGCAMGMMEYV